MSFSITTLQSKIIDALNGTEIVVKPLKTIDDLKPTATDPIVYIQYSGASYKSNSRNFDAEFQVYVIHKSLSVAEKQSIYSILDFLREKLIMLMIDYETYTKKSRPAQITSEKVAESQSSTFVYMINFKIEVRI